MPHVLGRQQGQKLRRVQRVGREPSKDTRYVSPSNRRIWSRSPVARGLPYAIASASDAEARSYLPPSASSRAASTDASRALVVALTNSAPALFERLTCRL